MPAKTGVEVQVQTSHPLEYVVQPAAASVAVLFA